MCKRILEAVEFNSLKCLGHLLETYENLSKLQSKSMKETKLPELDIGMRRRRFGLNWPTDDIPEGSPIHLMATRRSSLGTMQLVANYPNFMTEFVNKPDSEGSTPLVIAIKANNVEIALYLLDSGNEDVIIQKNSRKESPIYLAALNGQTDIIKEILNRCG